MARFACSACAETGQLVRFTALRSVSRYCFVSASLAPGKLDFVMRSSLSVARSAALSMSARAESSITP